MLGVESLQKGKFISNKPLAMPFFSPKWLLLLAVVAAPALLQAQQGKRLPKPVVVAKVHRPNDLRVRPYEVELFYNALFDEEISFSKLKLAKTDEAYYLLAEKADGTGIYAFELDRRGKRVCLEPLLPVHICEQGDLSIRTFLEIDGKIGGCRQGPHKVKQVQHGG